MKTTKDDRIAQLCGLMEWSLSTGNAAIDAAPGEKAIIRIRLSHLRESFGRVMHEVFREGFDKSQSPVDVPVSGVSGCCGDTP